MRNQKGRAPVCTRTTKNLSNVTLNSVAGITLVSSLFLLLHSALVCELLRFSCLIQYMHVTESCQPYGCDPAGECMLPHCTIYKLRFRLGTVCCTGFGDMSACYLLTFHHFM